MSDGAAAVALPAVAVIVNSASGPQRRVLGIMMMMMMMMMGGRDAPVRGTDSAAGTRLSLGLRSDRNVRPTWIASSPHVSFTNYPLSDTGRKKPRFLERF